MLKEISTPFYKFFPLFNSVSQNLLIYTRVNLFRWLILVNNNQVKIQNCNKMKISKNSMITLVEISIVIILLLSFLWVLRLVV